MDDTMDETDEEFAAAAREAVDEAENVATLVATIVESMGGKPIVSVAAGVLAPALALMTRMEEPQRNLTMKLVDAMLKARDIPAAMAYLGEVGGDEKSESN